VLEAARLGGAPFFISWDAGQVFCYVAEWLNLGRE
jgi:hypothetical protein